MGAMVMIGSGLVVGLTAGALLLLLVIVAVAWELFEARRSGRSAEPRGAAERPGEAANRELPSRQPRRGEPRAA